MAATRTSTLNRKQRKALARRLQSADPGLDVMHPNAAGIDVGNSTHYVAVRPDRDPNPVRRFDCFTADLHRLADWLEQCGVTTVAMQSTGVYWIPLYALRDPGRARPGGVPGERQAHEESARAEKRRAREPVAVEAAHLRFAAQFVSSDRRGSRHPDLLASTWRPRARHQHLHPANAKDADAAAHSARECHQRPERLDRDADRSRDSRWRTGSAGARHAASSRDSRQPRHDRQEPRRDVAAGPPICPPTRSRDVRRVRTTHR